MIKLSELDWAKASNEDRKSFYRAVKNSIDNGWLNLNELFLETLGRVPELTDDFTLRWRRGTLARHYYAPLAQTYEQKCPDAASSLALKLSTSLSRSSDALLWDKLLAERGIKGKLMIINPFALGLTRRDEPNSNLPLKITHGSPYCFSLNSDISGAVLVVERHETGDWHPIALGQTDQDFGLKIDAGIQHLPWDAKTQSVIPLREYADIGLRQFAMIIADSETLSSYANSFIPEHEVPITLLNELAGALLEQDKDSWKVHTQRVVFAAQ
ncbi:MAG TPA: hypothetical protein DCS30_12490 [Rhizobiales bacterium]|nr:hypothetical protein [Hyphomicrobiales bacterium]